MKNKKVLVTGRAGFIGSNLVKYLIENSNQVKYTPIVDLEEGIQQYVKWVQNEFASTI